MKISSIPSNQNLAISNRNLYRTRQQMNSGKKINTAADDAAGLAIAQRLLKQSNSLKKATDNAATFQDMSKIAEGALGSVTDSLQRIRELGLQASNGLYTDSDKAMIQTEIDQLKQHISDTTSQTQFNTKNLLDGSNNSWNAAINADGSGMKVDMPVSTLEKLGIADFDVTKDFDLNTIDKAIDMVSTDRGSLGALSNRLDYAMANNSYTALNTTASQSRIEDLDYGKAVTEQKKQQVLFQYGLMMQRKKMEDENGRMQQLFTR